MNALFADPMIYRLGWVLVHFIWQGALAALVLAVLLQFLHRHSANVRYLVACLVLLIMVFSPVLTFLKITSPFASPNLYNFSPFVPDEQTVQELQEPQPKSSAEVSHTQEKLLYPDELILHRWNLSLYIEPYLPWAVLYWLFGVLLLSVWRFGGWVEIQRIKKRCVKPLVDNLSHQFHKLADKVHIHKSIQFMESMIADVPATIGWLKPVILIPTSALTGLPPKQLETIIVHELAYIRRHDYLINLIQSSIETLFFYHPAVWWVSHKIRQERELCCDEIVVNICKDPVSYARALTNLEKLRHIPSQLVMGANGGNLLNRIQHLLNQRTYRIHGSSFWLTGLISSALVLVLCITVYRLAISANTDTLILQPVGIFDNSIDIGDSVTSGQVEYDEQKNEYSLKSIGRGIGGWRDNCLFTYKKMSGSWMIEATFDWEIVSSYAQAFIGLMCRENLDASSKQTFIVYYGDFLFLSGGFRSQSRSQSQNFGDHLPSFLNNKPLRCRLTRLACKNQLIYQWHNHKTGQWITVREPIVFQMAEEVYVGLTSCSVTTETQTLPNALVRDVKIESIFDDDLWDAQNALNEDENTKNPTIARRILPDVVYEPGTPVRVRIEIKGEPGVVTVEETPPSGWKVSDISHQNKLYRGTITWNLNLFSGLETLSYTVTPPMSETEDRRFSGKTCDRKISGLSRIEIRNQSVSSIIIGI